MVHNNLWLTCTLPGIIIASMNRKIEAGVTFLSGTMLLGACSSIQPDKPNFDTSHYKDKITVGDDSFIVYCYTNNAQIIDGGELKAENLMCDNVSFSDSLVLGIPQTNPVRSLDIVAPIIAIAPNPDAK